jgi:hypothetical protein
LLHRGQGAGLGDPVVAAEIGRHATTVNPDLGTRYNCARPGQGSQSGRRSRC